VYGEEFFTEGNKFGQDSDPSWCGDRNAERHWARVTSYLSKGRLLDVGCATGDFLLTFDPEAWSLYGLEYSDFAARSAQARTTADIVCGELTDVINRLPLGSFDAITLWDVIEHVRNPRLYLECCKALLGSGGLLFLTTGEFDSLAAKVMGRRWHLMIPPKHLFYFSRRGLFRLLEETGFEILSTAYDGRFVSREFLVQKVQTKHGLKLPAVLGRMLPKVIYLNLRDTLLIVARSINGN